MGDTTGVLSADNIRNKVYTIRGQQVMLDTDLAEIYGYEVKRLNEQVKNNKSRFPEDFMFQVHKEEIPDEFLKSKISTLKNNGEKRGMHIKNSPMLLRNKASICLLRFFVANWQSSKAFLSCAPSAKCAII